MRTAATHAARRALGSVPGLGTLVQVVSSTVTWLLALPVVRVTWDAVSSLVYAPTGKDSPRLRRGALEDDGATAVPAAALGDAWIGALDYMVVLPAAPSSGSDAGLRSRHSRSGSDVEAGLSTAALAGAARTGSPTVLEAPVPRPAVALAMLSDGAATALGASPFDNDDMVSIELRGVPPGAPSLLTLSLVTQVGHLHVCAATGCRIPCLTTVMGYGCSSIAGRVADPATRAGAAVDQFGVDAGVQHNGARNQSPYSTGPQPCI